MKKLEQTLTILAIIILLILIFLKIESDQQARMDAAEMQLTLSYQALIENEITINEIQGELKETKHQIEEWDNIDRRWIDWIRENWHLVKVVDGGQ